MKRLQEDLWQIYAWVYDGLRDVYAYQDLIRAVVQSADAGGQRVLDVGAGTGNISAALLDDGAAFAILVDVSANMLARSRAKLGADTRAEYLQGDAAAIMSALPEASLDRIVAVNSLYALPDRAAFFVEARRLLTSDGFVVAAHAVRPGAAPVVREQVRRGGVRALLKPHFLGIALIDLLIDAFARSGRFDFTPVRQLIGEAAAAGLGTQVLGPAYEGIDELIVFRPHGAPEDSRTRRRTPNTQEGGPLPEPRR